MHIGSGQKHHSPTTERPKQDLDNSRRKPHDSELSVHTADINTTRLHWNSVVSTENAKYMCLDIKNFYLTATLEYYKLS